MGIGSVKFVGDFDRRKKKFVLGDLFIECICLFGDFGVNDLGLRKKDIEFNLYNVGCFNEGYLENLK